MLYYCINYWSTNEQTSLMLQLVKGGADVNHFMHQQVVNQ